MGDFILNSENIVKIAVVALGPNVITVLGFNKLYGNAQPIPRLTNASFKYMTNRQVASDLTYIDCTPLVNKS
jgi:hypothetical protein